jgi:hypothetical protein
MWVVLRVASLQGRGECHQTPCDARPRPPGRLRQPQGSFQTSRNRITFYLSGADHWALGSRRCYVSGFHTRRRHGPQFCGLAMCTPLASAPTSRLTTLALRYRYRRRVESRINQPDPIRSWAIAVCGEAQAPSTLFNWS